MGIWNAEEKRYAYKAIPLEFPKSIIRKANGEIAYYRYQLLNHLAEGTLRTLAGFIPPTYKSQVLMSKWLQLDDRNAVISKESSATGSAHNGPDMTSKSDGSNLDYLQGDDCPSGEIAFCAEIAEKGQELLNQHGLRYYPTGTIPYGGRGGPAFGVLLSDIWINYYIDNIGEVTDSDGTKIRINFEYALAHEIEHAMGRSHISESDWRTPNAVKCSGL